MSLYDGTGKFNGVTASPNPAPSPTPATGTGLYSPSGTFNGVKQPTTPTTPQPSAPASGIEPNAFSPQGLRDAAPVKDVVLGIGQAAKETNDALNSWWSPLGWISKGVSAVADNLPGNLAGKSGRDLATGAETLARATLGDGKVDAIKNKVSSVGNAVKDSAFGKTYLQGDVPAALNAVNNVSNVAATVSMGKALPEVVGPDIAAAGKAMKDHYVNSELEGWTKPSTVNRPGFATPREIMQNSTARGGNIPETLVKNGIQLSDNIEGGKYSTEETATHLRNDAIKSSNEFLRPSLQMADYTTPKTPVADIVKATVSDLEGSRGAIPGDVEAQVAKAKAEGAALERKFPDGMSLTDMHDHRITYSQNGKYSPVGDTNVNNSAAVNRAFGRSFADTVVEKAPKTIPVDEFQKELQKHFQAADYLDSIHGKTVPRSILQRTLNYGAKALGAAAGNGIGGGILGGVGGYHVGGLLESMLENMSNPVKGHFLNTLEMTNPEAFSAIKKYMGEEKMAQFQRRMLPPASPLGSSRNPIVSQAPTVIDKGIPQTVKPPEPLGLPAGNGAIPMKGEVPYVGDRPFRSVKPSK